MQRVAINAMLLARRISQGVDGYKSVTLALRRFADELNRHIVELDGQFESLGRAIAGQRKSLEVQRKFHRVDELCAEAGYKHSVDIRRIDRQIDIVKQHGITVRRSLQGKLQNALRLCMTGESLSVNAKVEAGRISADEGRLLMDVSLQVQQLVEQIKGNILQANKLLNVSS